MISRKLYHAVDVLTSGLSAAGFKPKTSISQEETNSIDMMWKYGEEGCSVSICISFPSPLFTTGEYNDLYSNDSAMLFCKILGEGDSCIHCYSGEDNRRFEWGYESKEKRFFTHPAFAEFHFWKRAFKKEYGEEKSPAFSIRQMLQLMVAFLKYEETTS